MSAERKPAAEVYHPIMDAGREQLKRPVLNLLTSAFTAGLEVCFGPAAIVVVAGRLHDLYHLGIEQALFLGGFLFPIGLLFVALGKFELSEANTLTLVAGLFSGEGIIGKLARLWSVVFLLNVLGTIAFSLLVAHAGPIFDPFRGSYRVMGLNELRSSFLQIGIVAILGGWVMALMAWLLESIEGAMVQFSSSTWRGICSCDFRSSTASSARAKSCSAYSRAPRSPGRSGSRTSWFRRL